MNDARRHWLYAGWLLALVAFHMPWTVHDTAAFTLNGLDLGEQIRYHPAVIAETPTLRSSMLLWAAIPIIAWGLALTAQRYRNTQARLWLTGLAGLVALRMNPPEGAVRRPRLLIEDDYAFAFTLLTLLGVGGVGLLFLLGRRIEPYTRGVNLALCLLALGVPLLGLSRAFDILDGLGLSLGIGGGWMLYSGVLLGVALLSGVRWPQGAGDPTEYAEAA